MTTDELPADIADALQGHRDAQALWRNLPPSHRKEYLDWICGAKRPATRETRIRKMLVMLTQKAPGKT